MSQKTTPADSDVRDIVCIGGGLSTTSFLTASKQRVTVIMANDFIEWSLAATYFICKPDEHFRFVSANKEAFQFPNAEYIYDVVKQVITEEKKIYLASGRTISYRSLVLSTGFKLPLIHCPLGVSLQERRAELIEWAAALRKANTIVINGAGAIGFELAGDIKLRFPSARVIVLTRSGRIYNDAYPEEVLAKLRVQINRLGIEVLKATVAPQMTEPLRVSGTLQLSNSDLSTLDFDAYIPAYAQAPNTEFLPPSMLHESSKDVLTNDFLQSTIHPEVFAIGVNTSGEGFSAMLLQKQAQDVAKNVAQFLRSGRLTPHSMPRAAKDLNWGARPGVVKIGYGPGGYAMFDNLPAFPDKCCFRFCGFPFCPAPCCYPCCGGLQGAFGCGWCCGGNPEGQATMACFLGVAGVGGVNVFPGNFGMKGMGEAITKSNVITER